MRFHTPARLTQPARKDPTRLRVIVRSPDAMDLDWGIRVVRFRANNAGIMRARCRDRYIKVADVAEVVGVAKIGSASPDWRLVSRLTFWR